MALDIDIVFSDGDGKAIEGSCEQTGREGKSIGPLEHSPVKIWKEIDKASPFLAQACYDQIKRKDASIRFWRAVSEGKEDNYFACKLKGVRNQAHSVE